MSEGDDKTPLEEAAKAATDETPTLEAATTDSEGSLSKSADAAAGVPDKAKLEVDIIEALKTIFDPEIPVNIYELGLIYEINIADCGDVHTVMTLTAPGCPVAGPLVQEVEIKVGQVPGVGLSHTELVFDPPWTMERMSESARLALGML